MELRKKTIIWEDNNEPPKDYIWAKKDGKFYEYSYTTRGWVESKSISKGNSGGSDDGAETPSSLGFPFFLDKPVGFLCRNNMNWEGDHLCASEDAIIPLDGILSYCEAQDNVEDWAQLSFSPIIEYEEKYDRESDKFVGHSPYCLGLINVSYLSSREPHWQLEGLYGGNDCFALHIGDKKYSVQMYISD